MSAIKSGALAKVDHAILHMQDGFPVYERPFWLLAARMGISEIDLILRIHHLIREGRLKHIGPVFNESALAEECWPKGQCNRCMMLSGIDKSLIRMMKRGVPLSPRPFDQLARRLDICGDEVICRIERMGEWGLITRFGVVPGRRNWPVQSLQAQAG